MGLTVQSLDHIGIIVKDLDVSVKKYEHVLGIKLDRIEDYGDGLLRIAFLPLKNVLIELIQPLKPGSAAWDFLQEHGEGIEHIAFEVDDLEAEWEKVMDKRIPVRDKEPKPGAGGTRICFLEPAALNGVLGEFVTHKK
jgi:methylmalonyl-CoA/ethylmalonyl-CoA epimerase